MNRKLTVILAADLAGYSRLIAEDEEETLRRLAVYRGVFEDLVAHSRGRVFNTAGDAILAEFPSAVEALRCAIDVQESLRTRNLAYPPSRQMCFRMGMTVGDVVERDGDLLGDGVNIAARLQTLAQPGGICISKSMHDAVSNKLSASYSDMGLHTVKNIPNPVHVYNVGLTSAAPPPPPARSMPLVRAGLILSFAVALIAGVAFAYLAGVRSPLPDSKIKSAHNAADSSSENAATVVTPPAVTKEASASDRPPASPAAAAPNNPPESASPRATIAEPDKSAAAPDVSTSQPPEKQIAAITPPKTDLGSQDAEQLSRLRSMQWTSCRGEDTSAAIAACTRLVDAADVQGSDLALAHERLAYALRKQGKIDEAIAAFTKSLDLAKSSDAYNERGTAYFIKGQIDNSIADYNRAIAEDANNGEAFNNRAWAYYTVGRTKEALVDADKAVALSPDKAYVWDTHGHIEEKLTNRDAAIEDFRKALSLDPKLQSSEAGLKRLRAD